MPSPSRPAPAEVLSALTCPDCGGALDRELRCGRGHDLQVIEWTPFPHSHIVRLRDRSGRCLVLKVPLIAAGEGAVVDVSGATDPASLARQVENEREAILHLAERLGDGPHRVPDLVPGDVPGRSILMRCVEGESLRDRLYGAAAWTRPEALGRGAEAAGAWLAAMATATTTEVAPLDPADVLERTRYFLDDMRRHGHPDREARRLEAAVDALAARAAGAPVARCCVHGDLRLGHVYVAPGRTTVIDFEQASIGWAHEDAAFFLASIDGFAGRSPLRRWSPGGRAAERRFLGGYLAAAPPGWEAVHDLFRVAAMIRALRSNYRGRMARTRPRLFRRVVVPHYQRWFDRRLDH